MVPCGANDPYGFGSKSSLLFFSNRFFGILFLEPQPYTIRPVQGAFARVMVPGFQPEAGERALLCWPTSVFAKGGGAGGGKLAKLSDLVSKKQDLQRSLMILFLLIMET